MLRYLKIFGLLLLSAYVATWLRMFDRRLVWQSWEGLLGKPFRIWAGTILFGPVLDNLQSWPAYVLGGILFVALANAFGPLTHWKSALLAATIGGTIYLLFATLQRSWLMEGTFRVLEQLVPCVLAAALAGFLFYGTQPTKAPVDASLPGRP